MTTEDDFQAALDREPGDWQTRLVFADWLEDRDDPRAEGYRALGALRKNPYHYADRLPNRPTWGFWNAGAYGAGVAMKDVGRQHLPQSWFEQLPDANSTQDYMQSWWPHVSDRLTRRAAEDAAALAFAKLPPNRRAELLAGV